MGETFASLPCAAMLLAGLAVASCSQPVQVRGNMPDVEAITQIQPGRNTREEVVEILGTPSSVSTFRSDHWYYIGEKAEQFAFLRPSVLDRSVLLVTFNDNGVVDETKLYTLSDSREIDLVERETPTEGRELTIWQQLIGNIGRFQTPEEGENR